MAAVPRCVALAVLNTGGFAPPPATDRFSPSMRQRIDLARLYRRALHVMPETIDGLSPRPVPQVCPVTLDELLFGPP